MSHFFLLVGWMKDAITEGSFVFTNERWVREREREREREEKEKRRKEKGEKKI